MAYVVIATWTARPGKEQDVHRALTELIQPSRDEPGCQFYMPAVAPENPRVFTLLEVYDDEQAYDAHRASEHFRQLAVEDGIPLLESRERIFLRGLA